MRRPFFHGIIADMSKKKSNKQKAVELLKKRFDLDEENKVFDIRLKLDNLDPLIDRSISSENAVYLSEGADDLILRHLKDIPHGYKGDVTLQIADYEGYSKDAVKGALRETIELNRIRFKKENRRKDLLIILMTLAGLLFIILSKTVLSSIFDNYTLNAIVVETLDIIGWVFLWEAVTVLFLNPSEILKNGSLILFKMKSFNLE